MLWNQLKSNALGILKVLKRLIRPCQGASLYGWWGRRNASAEAARDRVHYR